MGKKKDCFGVEDYVCMTNNCPYAKECINEVLRKRMERVMARRGGGSGGPAKRRSPGRVSVGN